jgi:hypothetical protein
MEKAADPAALFFSTLTKCAGWTQPPLPPITARTVSSGPKSSAPST